MYVHKYPLSSGVCGWRVRRRRAQARRRVRTARARVRPWPGRCLDRGSPPKSRPQLRRVRIRRGARVPAPRTRLQRDSCAHVIAPLGAPEIGSRPSCMAARQACCQDWRRLHSPVGSVSIGPPRSPPRAPTGTACQQGLQFVPLRIKKAWQIRPADLLNLGVVAQVRHGASE